MGACPSCHFGNHARLRVSCWRKQIGATDDQPRHLRESTSDELDVESCVAIDRRLRTHFVSVFARHEGGDPIEDFREGEEAVAGGGVVDVAVRQWTRTPSSGPHGRMASFQTPRQRAYARHGLVTLFEHTSPLITRFRFRRVRVVAGPSTSCRLLPSYILR